MIKWQTRTSEKVYSTPWFSVRKDEVSDHNGNHLTYSVVDLIHPAVFIVALNDKREVYLQKQYRYTIDQELWTLPAGHSDGQNLLSAAKRELLEETGYRSDQWTKLGNLYSSVGIGNIPMSVFLAEDIKQISNRTDDDEGISESRFVGFSELKNEFLTGKIQEGAVVASLTLAEAYLYRNRERK